MKVLKAELHHQRCCFSDVTMFLLCRHEAEMPLVGAVERLKSCELIYLFENYFLWWWFLLQVFEFGCRDNCFVLIQPFWLSWFFFPVILWFIFLIFIYYIIIFVIHISKHSTHSQDKYWYFCFFVKLCFRIPVLLLCIYVTFTFCYSYVLPLNLVCSCFLLLLAFSHNLTAFSLPFNTFGFWVAFCTFNIMLVFSLFLHFS